MLYRTVCVLVITTFLIHSGCAKRVPVDVYPVHRPSDRVKTQDKVTLLLREETVVRGTAGPDSLTTRPVEWTTREITGRLVKWDDRLIAVRVIGWRPGQDATFEVPLENLDQVDRWDGPRAGPVLTAIGGTLLVLGITLLIILAISKPSADEDSL